MSEDLPTIVLTRPEPQAAAFAARLRALVGEDVRIVISPVIEIRSVEWHPPSRSDFAIVTSAHAVPALSRLSMRPGAPVYCVGPATADVIRAAGFRPVAGPGTAEGLIRTIRAEAPPGEGLYLRGHHVSTDVAGQLRDHGLSVAEAVVYDQRAVPLSDTALALLAGPGPVVLPLFSARTARLVSDEVPMPGPCLRPVAISDGVARAWPPGHPAPTVAATPDAAGMVAAVAAACRSRDAC